MTHEQIRELLTAMSAEVHAAQRYVADGRYELAAECLESVATVDGMVDIIGGLRALAEENPPHRCLMGVCEGCEQLDAVEYR